MVVGPWGREGEGQEAAHVEGIREEGLGLCRPRKDVWLYGLVRRWGQKYKENGEKLGLARTLVGVTVGEVVGAVGARDGVAVGG